MPASAPQQLLHLVIGGELTDLGHTTFKDLSQVEIVGLFPNYATAYTAWKAKGRSRPWITRICGILSSHAFHAWRLYVFMEGVPPINL